MIHFFKQKIPCYQISKIFFVSINQNLKKAKEEEATEEDAKERE